MAEDLKILNQVNGNLPFSVSIHDEEQVKEELRLKHRYLDLRRERMKKNLRLRNEVIKAARNFLETEKFL